MFKSSVRVLFAVLLCAVVAVFPTLAETNNSLDDGFEWPFLENGDTVEASFETGHDSQIYAFVASANDRVTIRMAQVPDDSPLDPLLIVLGMDGAVVAYDDDGGANPYFSALIDGFIVPEDGLYLIIATHKEGPRFPLAEVIGESALAGGLDYTLSINGITPPTDFELDDATLPGLIASVGERVLVEISAESAVAFVTFEARDGQTLTLETDDPGDGVDTILLLFDAAGRRIGINDDAPGIGMLSRLEIDIEDDGLYLAMVTAYLYERTAESDFTWTQDGITGLSIR
ncbi:MAG: hypothetical protein EA396_02345 [Anaerolineaceae bacterium]|nr:MAG: hypothetical protein EA396_02345 [Anaerolineaceae bacterium]